MPSPAKTAAAAPIACTPKHLGNDLLTESARVARNENPVNHPAGIHRLLTNNPEFAISSENIAVLTTKYWRGGGCTLTVGFLDNPPVELRRKILQHMNAWNASANVTFTESNVDPKVRISRERGGYWSYLGTDILLIDKAKQTMNLEGFTMATPDSEFHRVVRHETGHTLGCPHEHMRAELIARIDRAKAIEYYGQTQGWSEEQVIRQVLTPLEEGSLWGTPRPDMDSIMCYQIPAGLTTDGRGIPGGADIDPSDYAFMAQVYPKPAAVPAPDGAPEAAAAVTGRRRSCPDCVEVELAGGTRVSVHPDASEEQVRRVFAALAG
jgi:hypothetical protein